mmetsp:Transcript_34380/g.75257  ORF Transcript_34380/g.75257 Transcript_34380/m.75257 type:complete len:205 (+) Transcript_34380:1696-2310(+)
MAAKKIEMADALRETRSQRDNLVGMDTWNERAAEANTDHDISWENQSVVGSQRRERLAKMMGINYWQRIKFGQGFLDEVRQVLPHVWRDDMTDARTKKKDVILAIRLHLDLVKSIAEKTVENTLAPEIDLSNLDATEIKLMFIKVDDSAQFQRTDTAFKKRLELNNDILKSCGTTVANRARYGVDITAYEVLPVHLVEDSNDED